MDNAENGIRRYIAWMSVAFLVVVADQATKWAILEWVPKYGTVPINDFLRLTHLCNEGAAFSFLADAGGWQRWFFISLASVVSVIIAWWMWTLRKGGPLILIAGLALVLGGAIGNLIDRINAGCVTDFISVFHGDWYFPSFNVADSAITVGAAFLIIDALFFSGRETKAEKKLQNPDSKT